MEIFIKLFMISIFFIFIYFWNKFVPKWIIRATGRSWRGHNFENLSKQEKELALAPENFIIKIIQYFYWIGFIGFVYGILTNDLSEFGK